MGCEGEFSFTCDTPPCAEETVVESSTLETSQRSPETIMSEEDSFSDGETSVKNNSAPATVHTDADFETVNSGSEQVTSLAARNETRDENFDGRRVGGEDLMEQSLSAVNMANVPMNLEGNRFILKVCLFVCS